MDTLPDHLGGHLNITNTDSTILPYLKQSVGIKTMIDIGCGPGGMKNIAESLDIEWTGVDGDFTLPNKDEIIIHDFSKGPLVINKTFDLAWSTEFLEHVEEEYIENYMPVFQKASMAVVTAAAPGTPGYHHVNCKDLSYWSNVFARYGFEYDSGATMYLKQISNMRKNFFNRHGFCFKKDKEYHNEV